MIDMLQVTSRCCYEGIHDTHYNTQWNAAIFEYSIFLHILRRLNCIRVYACMRTMFNYHSSQKVISLNIIYIFMLMLDMQIIPIHEIEICLHNTHLMHAICDNETSKKCSTYSIFLLHMYIYSYKRI